MIVVECDWFQRGVIVPGSLWEVDRKESDTFFQDRCYHDSITPKELCFYHCIRIIRELVEKRSNNRRSNLTVLVEECVEVWKEGVSGIGWRVLVSGWYRGVDWL